MERLVARAAYPAFCSGEVPFAHWKSVLEIEPDRPDRIELLNLINRYSTEE